MSYADTLLPEFDQEMANTRKVLECIPDDKLDWRADPKLNTIGWNANHLAEIVAWVEGTIANSSWDYAPVDGEPYQMPTLSTSREIIEAFDRNVASGRKAIEGADEAAMGEMWSLLEGGKPIITLPRSAVIRSFVLNHLIHHRAHLCVYLRLNGISVPGMYGPSAD